VDLPLGHCEQSWEGGKSRLVSPDTGLIAYEQKKAREAASWQSLQRAYIFKARLVARISSDF